MKKMIYVLLFLLSIMSAFALNVEVLTTDPAPIVAGDYADITISVENELGDPVSDVMLGFEKTSFMTPISPDEGFLTIQDGQTVTRTFRVYFSDELAQGTIDVPISISTGDNKVTQEVSLFIQKATSLPDLEIGSVRSIPNELVPDSDDNQLTVTIMNLGDKDAQLVKAQLVSDAAFVRSSYSFSMTDSLASINAGTQDTLSFTIDIDKDARGEIPTKLELTYRAQNSGGTSYSTYTKMLELGIPVIDSPFLEIVDVEQLDSFESGSTDNRVRLTIKNTGEAEAQEVRVRVLPDISYPLIFALTTEYVGSKIKPGDEAKVEFDVEVFSDTSAKNLSITAQLESLVGETRYTQDSEFFIQTRESVETTTQQVGLIAIIAILLISFIIGWNVYKSKKR